MEKNESFSRIRCRNETRTCPNLTDLCGKYDVVMYPKYLEGVGRSDEVATKKLDESTHSIRTLRTEYSRSSFYGGEGGKSERQFE